MLIVMRAEATAEQIEKVCERVRKQGYDATPIPGGRRTAIGIVGNEGAVDPAPFVGLPGVMEAVPVSAPYKQVSREWRAEDTVVRLPNGAEIGGGSVCVMSGPCAVESEAQIFEAARLAAGAGAAVLRGGAFKPRTSPYAFQGLGEQGLVHLRAAAQRHGLATVTEAIDDPSLELVAEYADVVQIGARNMQNYALLKRAGSVNKPVVLKRGPAATIKEWLLAAEYILDSGNPDVILCERGIRSFDPSTRNVLDVCAIPMAKDLSHLPVIADPSHGTGVRDKVSRLALASVAAGCDGLIVEMHPRPEEARSDGMQSLYPEQLEQLVARVRDIAAVLGREVAAPTREGISPRSSV